SGSDFKAAPDRLGDRLQAGAVARLGTIRLWHWAGTYPLGFSGDGTALITTGGDGWLTLWDQDDGRLLQAPDPRQAGISPQALSPDRKTVPYSLQDYSGSLRDLATGKELHRLQAPGYAATVYAFSPDGKLLASGSTTGPIKLWDVATGNQV